jgi:uncharacterized membrane protein (DUF106 family)
MSESNSKKKEGSFRAIGIFFIISMLIAFNWDNWPWLKNGIHYILDPTAGWLLNWELTIGMLIIVFVISLVTTVVQKYATDQDTLREMKKEQKEIQKQMKEFKQDPKKLAHLQKKQFSMMPKQMKLSMRAIIYTGIPFILFFRWFDDFFKLAGSPKFFGFLGWFMFYLIATIVFSSIMKKKLDVV